MKVVFATDYNALHDSGIGLLQCILELDHSSFSSACE